MSVRIPRAWIVLSIIVAVFVLALFVSLGLNAASAETTSTMLWLDPPGPSHYVGDTAEVVIQMDDVSDVFGAHVEVNFNPDILSVVDADSSKDGIQIRPGSCPSPDFVAENTVTVSGNVRYAAAQLSPTPSCDGGVVATISFRCEGEGSSTLVLTNTLISDPEANPISHSVEGGTFTCDLLPTGYEIVGNVSLQGWSDPSGIKVTLYDSIGAIADGPLAVGSDGAFALAANEVLETYSVKAEHDRYLEVNATGITSTPGVTVELGLATLPAGDLNGDGRINIQDVNLVAGNFGKESPVAWGP